MRGCRTKDNAVMMREYRAKDNAAQMRLSPSKGSAFSGVARGGGP